MIVLEISIQDIGVCSVEMIEDGTGVCRSVSHVFMTVGTDEHIIHNGEENLAEGFVGAIIRVEDCSSNVVRVTESRDLGDCGGIWDNRFRDRVDKHNERVI